MRIHILGICGTFMGGVAILAKEQGHIVTGSDLNVYPPMSTQLAQHGIQIFTGYEASHIESNLEYVVIGNVITRGNPAMEHILATGVPYMSGPQWLAENILKNKLVLGVAGTHGKTTTASLLAWILEYAGLQPGFLIGGVPKNFSLSARLGKEPYFVIEADEYDSAFFDKRSKFIHYRLNTVILNNLEFDHADIFPNLAAMQQQFHHCIRTIPSNGCIIRYEPDNNLTNMLALGCWTPVTTFGGERSEWQARLQVQDGSEFTVCHQGCLIGPVHWSLLGLHNVNNALAAIAAAQRIGISPAQAIMALHTFQGVKRRMEMKGKAKEIMVYDDFAHHPTAIATTLAGLRARLGQARIIAVLEFGSYSMRSGVYQDSIAQALCLADMVVCKRPATDAWNLQEKLSKLTQPVMLFNDVAELVQGLVPQLKAGDHVVVMSNTGFENVHTKLLDAIIQN